MSKTSTSKKLIIGLGNPGKEYKDTWHNAGFMFVDFIKKELENDYQHALINKKTYEVASFPSLNLKLLKPLTFMNNSGVVVADFFKFNKYKVDEIYLVHDDLDIALGKYKLTKGKFPRVHNGVNSVIDSTGKKGYNYVRIGIETREGDLKNIPGEKYVLSKVGKENASIMREINKKLMNLILSP